MFKSGDKWMIYGPCSFIPNVSIEVLERRQTICLDKNEGVYIRDTRTGEVKSHTGTSYMLKSYEELWEMELIPEVEKELSHSYFDKFGKRIKYKVVSFRVPFNSAV